MGIPEGGGFSLRDFPQPNRHAALWGFVSKYSLISRLLFFFKFIFKQSHVLHPPNFLYDLLFAFVVFFCSLFQSHVYFLVLGVGYYYQELFSKQC